MDFLGAFLEYGKKSDDGNRKKEKIILEFCYSGQKREQKTMARDLIHRFPTF